MDKLVNKILSVKVVPEHADNKSSDKFIAEILTSGVSPDNLRKLF